MKLFLYLMRINEIEFLLPKKYLSIKGVFSVENRILDSVGMSLPSARQTQATSTQVLFVLEKRKRKYFFLFCFPRHAPNYPALSMLQDPISNELSESIANPPQIFESCLSHVTASIEHPHSILDKTLVLKQPPGPPDRHRRNVQAQNAWMWTIVDVSLS